MTHNEYQQNIQTMMLRFFQSIGQKDLVFNNKIRQVLRKHYQDKEISENHQQDPEVERKRIGRAIKKLRIVRHLGLSRVQKATSKNLIKALRKQYRASSQLFPTEVTPQLYAILSRVINIVFKFHKSLDKMSRRLRQFGDSIVSLQNQQNKYFYFGFKMFSLPEGKTEDDIPQLKKHHPQYRYVLNREYRQAQGPFADFTQKIGGHFFRLLKELQGKNKIFD